MPGSRTILTAAAAALLITAPPAAAQSAADVDVVDIDFVPDEVTVDAGATVTWTQSGSLPHTVTADDGSFDSHPDCSGGDACMGNGDTFEQTFDEPGEYPYYCRIHGGPGGVGMAGVVVVTAAQDETPTDEPTEAAPTEDAPTEDAATEDATADDEPTTDAPTGDAAEDELPETGGPLGGLALFAGLSAVGGVVMVRRTRRTSP